MEEQVIRVKDVIEFLQTINPETPVSLDKNGWDYKSTPLETIENTYLFDVFKIGNKETLIIQN